MNLGIDIGDKRTKEADLREIWVVCSIRLVDVGSRIEKYSRGRNIDSCLQ